MQVKYPEIWAALAAPFHPDQVGQLEKGGRKLDFINARTAMNRLDEVLGPENWEDSFTETKDGFCCSITITLPDGTKVTKSDGGGFTDMKSEDDTEKSAYSDSFKRAAVKFGIARYLYKNGIPAWIECFHRGDRPLGEFIQSAAAFAGVSGDDMKQSILRQMAKDGVFVTGVPLIDFPANDGPEFRKMITRLAKSLKAENAAEAAAGVK